MIPVSEPIISKNAKKYVNEVLASGWVSSRGAAVEKFEKKYAEFCGTKYAVAVSSGTAAIHLALCALNISKDDEVIIPALSMIAAALPIIYVGAKPVLVDSEPQTGNIDPSGIEKKITKKTKAIIAVHFNGHPADMDSILKIAKKHKLHVIEDAAEAQGAQVNLANGWKKAGSAGTIGCFSFYGNKIITTGEGGMAVTNDRKLAERIRDLRNLDRSKEKHFYHKSIGFTYRMSSLCAALGIAQLEEANKYLEIKRKAAALYLKELNNIPAIILPEQLNYAKRIYWNFDILLSSEAKITSPQLAEELLKKHIETRNFVIPLNQQPAFLNLGFFKNEKYPVAEKISESGLTLPLGLKLKEKDIKNICQIVRKKLN